MTLRRKEVAFVVLLFAGALGLRLAHHAETVTEPNLRADARGYFIAAYNLHHFGVYSRDIAVRGGRGPERRTGLQPGYPLVLVPVIASADGKQEFVARVVTLQAWLGALLPVLVFLLARQGLPPLPSALAAIAAALSPHLIALDVFVLTDALFSVALTGSVLLFVWGVRRASSGTLLAAGFAFGVTQLLREVALPIPFVLALLLAAGAVGAAADERRRVAKRLGALLLGLALVWVPQQLIMNAHRAGHPVEEVNSIWLLVAHGSFPGLEHETDFRKRPPDFERLTTDFEYGSQRVLERMRDDPGRHLAWYLGGKALFMWRWDNLYVGDVYQYPMVRKGFEESALLAAIHSLMRALHGPLHWIAFASLLVVGRALLRRKPDEFVALAVPLIAVIAYHVATLTILMPVPRYSIPLRPFVYVLAAGAITAAVAEIQRRRTR